MDTGIYIGLGGSGIKTLVKLKAKIYQQYKSENRLYEFTKHTSFLFIDTDSNEFKQINSDQDLISMFDGNIPIELYEKIDIGDTIPAAVLAHANNYVGDDNTRLKSWMILENEGRYRPIHCNLSNGAGASRMDGRIALFKHYAVIKNGIKTAVSKMRSELIEGNEVIPNINIISGTNGGTGSALLLDISFLVNRVFLNQFQIFPNVKLALFAPQPYIQMPGNNGLSQYPLNSFATFWEMNAFKIGAYKPGLMNQLFVNAEYTNNVDFDQEPWNPYTYAIVFDTETNSGSSKISFNEMFENAANTLFKINSSPEVDSTLNCTLTLPLPNSISTKIGEFLQETEWSKTIVAAGVKSIEKPTNFLKSYLKTRFLYDIFSYGVIGAEFNDVYTEIEKSNFLKNFIRENIQVYLDESIQVLDKSNLERDINLKFININLGSAPEKRFLRGYEQNILLHYRDMYFSEIENTIKSITNEFEKTGQTISKEKYLSQIKTSLKHVLNNVVCEYGFQYVRGLVYSVNYELEGVILKELELNYNTNYNDTIEYELRSNIDIIAYENRDYEALVVACEEFKNFKVNKLVIEIKRELIRALSKNGYLDDLLSSNEKGLFSLISKLKNEEIILEKNLFSLSTEFLEKSNESTFVIYLPPLEGMIGVDNSSRGWKHGSEFETLYASMVSLDPSLKNVKCNGMMGTPPVRSHNERSLQEHLKQILRTLGDGQSQYFIDFADQNDFDHDAQTIASFKKAAESYIEKLIINIESVNIWLNELSIEQIFQHLAFKDRQASEHLKLKFNDSPVFYPNNAIIDSKFYLYSFPPELRNLAQSFGYDPGNSRHRWQESKNQNKLELTVIETGHSFDTYRYFEDYKNQYESKSEEIKALNYGCHIHKGFVHLDLEKAFKAVKNGKKPLLIEIAFYDIVLEIISQKYPVIYSKLFVNDVNDDPFAETTLPILTIENKGESYATLVIKPLLFDKLTSKLISQETVVLSVFGLNDTTALVDKSFDFNKQYFEPIIDSLVYVLKRNGNALKKEIQDIILNEWPSLRADFRKKIPDSISLMPDFDKLIKENIFSN